MASIQKKIKGTREWAVANIDCCTGCSHGCKYCYARYDAVVREGTVTSEEWQSCHIRETDVEKKHPHYPGQVMFPCTHDIVPENLEACIKVIENLLLGNNKILLVSKPHLSCITALCDHFQKDKESLLFRFTITANNNTILSLWEPFAPTYEERVASLRYAFRNGFATSVSIEPMLDIKTVVAMVKELEPSVTHSLWLGKMNKIDTRVVVDSDVMAIEVERVRAGQCNSRIKTIYEELKHNPLVFWKESIKEIVGLDLATQPGLDR